VSTTGRPKPPGPGTYSTATAITTAALCALTLRITQVAASVSLGPILDAATIGLTAVACCSAVAAWAWVCYRRVTAELAAERARGAERDRQLADLTARLDAAEERTWWSKTTADTGDTADLTNVRQIHARRTS
jgi:hypothetical protein